MVVVLFHVSENDLSRQFVHRGSQPYIEGDLLCAKILEPVEKVGIGLVGTLKQVSNKLKIQRRAK